MDPSTKGESSSSFVVDLAAAPAAPAAAAQATSETPGAIPVVDAVASATKDADAEGDAEVEREAARLKKPAFVVECEQRVSEHPYDITAWRTLLEEAKKQPAEAARETLEEFLEVFPTSVSGCVCDEKLKPAQAQV
jgi:hypothetical protein